MTLAREMYVEVIPFVGPTTTTTLGPAAATGLTVASDPPTAALEAATRMTSVRASVVVVRRNAVRPSIWPPIPRTPLVAATIGCPRGDGTGRYTSPTLARDRTGGRHGWAGRDMLAWGRVGGNDAFGPKLPGRMVPVPRTRALDCLGYGIASPRRTPAPSARSTSPNMTNAAAAKYR